MSVCKEVVLSEVDDLDLCMKELLSNADAMTMITSLKLVSLSLGAHHLELLGEVLGGSSDWRPAPVDEGEETEEVQMDLFDDVQDAVQAASPCQEKSLEEDVEVKGQQLKSLQILRCPGPSSDAWSPLWQSLPTSLTELDISENSLSDHAVAALCGALRQRSMRLTYLTLQGNRCKDVQRLADLISRGGVEILDLAENLLNEAQRQMYIGFYQLSCSVNRQTGNVHTYKRFQLDDFVAFPYNHDKKCKSVRTRASSSCVKLCRRPAADLLACVSMTIGASLPLGYPGFSTYFPGEADMGTA